MAWMILKGGCEFGEVAGRELMLFVSAFLLHGCGESDKVATTACRFAVSTVSPRSLLLPVLVAIVPGDQVLEPSVP